jgi:hypothetical protein
VTLEVLPGGKPRHEPDRRILAAGAPPSPSVVPLDLARHLEFGEALAWWGDKSHMERAPIIVAGTLVGVALLLVTLAVPEFWLQPLDQLWQPLVAVCLPLVFAVTRERLSRRAVLVTDTSIIEVDMAGRSSRLGFDNIRAVRRDLLRGGLRLEGAKATVRVPAVLATDARQAIASQRRGRVQTRENLDDPIGWLP